MLVATVDRHTRVYTYIYMHIPTDVYCRMMYVLVYILYVYVTYIVRICTYTRILTYFWNGKLLGELILS